MFPALRDCFKVGLKRECCCDLVYCLVDYGAGACYVHAHKSHTARAEHVAAIEAYMSLVGKEADKVGLLHLHLCAIEEHEE